MPKSKRSKACNVPQKVRETVCERDHGRCVICGAYGKSNAHFVPRSAGGLGIEQNVVTLCGYCHHMYDNGYDKHMNVREVFGYRIEKYLRSKYTDWDKSKLYYNRWSNES